MNVLFFFLDFLSFFFIFNEFLYNLTTVLTSILSYMVSLTRRPKGDWVDDSCLQKYHCPLEIVPSGYKMWERRKRLLPECENKEKVFVS